MNKNIIKIVGLVIGISGTFIFTHNVFAQTSASNNPLELIIKEVLPEPVKEIFDIANEAQKKMESKFGIDIEKMATGNSMPTSVAGSSQKITPEYTMNLLERVSALISSTNPADAPDFVGRATDIVRQFIKYIFSIMRQIVQMI